MLIDWLIRNADWITTILVSVLILLLLSRFLFEKATEYEPVSFSHGAFSLNKLLGTLFGGGKNGQSLESLLSRSIEGGHYIRDLNGIAQLLIGLPVNILRRLLIAFINSGLFKLVIAVLLLIFVASLAYKPIANAYDRAKISTSALTFPAPLCGRNEPSRILLFIHGWNGDDANTWTNFPMIACGDSTLIEYEIISIDYPTFVERRNLRISELADWVDTSLSETQETLRPAPISIIAHSMGGLIAKELVILNKLSDTLRIVNIVTIGSPHNGAVPANIAKTLNLDDALLEDMAQDSAYLTGLNLRWNRVKNPPPLICFSSPQDGVVKKSSAFHSCDFTVAYPQWDHSAMVKPESKEDPRYRLPISRILER